MQSRLSTIVLTLLICAIAFASTPQTARYETFSTGWGDEFYLEEPEDHTVLTRERIEELISSEPRLITDLTAGNAAAIFVGDEPLNILIERQIVSATGQLQPAFLNVDLPLDLPVDVLKTGMALQAAQIESRQKQLSLAVIRISELKAFLQKHKVLDDVGHFLGDPGHIELSEDQSSHDRLSAEATNNQRQLIRKPYVEMPQTQGFVVRRVLYEILETSLTAKPVDVPKRIRDTLARYGQFWEILAESPSLDQLIKTAGLPSPDSQSVAKALLESILKQPVISSGLKIFAGRRPLRRSQLAESRQVERRQELLNKIPDLVFHQIAFTVRQKVEELDLTGHDAIQAITKIQGPKQAEDLSEIMQLTLSRYFKKLSFEDKSRLALAYARLEPNASLESQIAAALQSTGPFIQKLFQLIGDEVDSDLIRRATRELKASVSPFPGRIARQIIEKSLGRPIHEIFSEFNDTPINAGTIGQIHVAKLKSTGQSVVVKVLRPGVLEHFQRELSIIMSIVENPLHRKIIETYTATIIAEMDFRTESKNTEKGFFMQKPKAGIFVATPVAEIPATRDVLVLAKAEGRPLDKYPLFQAVPDSGELKAMKKEDVETLSKRFTEIMKLWFANAMFGTGDFHGDIHTGNIMASLDNEKPATVIDFGNFQKLTVGQRQEFLRLSVAALKSNSRKAALIVGRLGGLAEDKIQELQKMLDDSQWQNLIMDDKMSSALAYGGRLGARLPAEFLNFARSKIMLATALQVVNRNLDILDPERNLYRRLNTNRIFGIAAVQIITRDIYERFTRNRRSEPILTASFIAEIVGELSAPQIAERCRKLFAKSPDEK